MRHSCTAIRAARGELGAPDALAGCQSGRMLLVRGKEAPPHHAVSPRVGRNAYVGHLASRWLSRIPGAHRYECKLGQVMAHTLREVQFACAGRSSCASHRSCPADGRTPKHSSISAAKRAGQRRSSTQCENSW